MGELKPAHIIGNMPTGLFGTAFVVQPSIPARTELVSLLTKPLKFAENAGLFAPYGRIALFAVIASGACATDSELAVEEGRKFPCAAKFAESE